MVENIEQFNKLIIKAYPHYKELVITLGHIEDEQQDILHLIEFGSDYKYRAKLATRLKELRNRRREIKNEIALYEPLILFLDKNKAVTGEIQRLLGDIRTIKGKQDNPMYFMRTSDEVLK